MPDVTQQTVEPALESSLPTFTSKPPVGSATAPLPHPKSRDRGVERSTHLAVHHLGMLEDGNDVTHHSHAQLIHDFLVEIQQHALLDPAGEGQQGGHQWARVGGPASPLTPLLSPSSALSPGQPYLLSTNITA